MSRQETERDDLLREATALARRAELISGDETVVGGFRANGWFSVYFGDDPAFTFDEALRLRRSYCGGFLYRTQGTTLARLERRRDAHTTELVRHDLSPGELDDFLAVMRGRLAGLLARLDAGDAAVVRCVGEEAALRAEICAALRGVLGQSALAPVIAGRR